MDEITGYNSAYKGSQIDSAVGTVLNKGQTWDSKQDKVTGLPGQIAGFDDEGNMEAQNPPDTGVTTFNGRTDAVMPQAGDYTAEMVGARPGEWMPSAEDVGARPNTWTPSAADVGAVPVERTVNDHALDENITLNATDVGARADTWMPSADDVGAIPASQKGTNGGVAELDSTGRVPSSQLPSYVDDVLEYNTLSSFPPTGEDGKIYIAEDTNLQYRWSGTQYVEISPSLALGETSSTAYRGDRGKTAYDHSQITTGNPHGTTAADVGARPSTWTPTAADVGAVPITRTVNGKQLNANISLTAADVNAASKATYVSVTLPNTGWSNNQRTLTVNGVLANATKQLIVPCPQNATALDVWTAAGVKAISQAANSLTFKCDSTPTASIPLYVAIIPIGG